MGPSTSPTISRVAGSILLMLEERKQPYLLRLRQTKNVQRLVAQQFARQDWSRPDNRAARWWRLSCNC